MLKHIFILNSESLSLKLRLLNFIFSIYEIFSFPTFSRFYFLHSFSYSRVLVFNYEKNKFRYFVYGKL